MKFLLAGNASERIRYESVDEIYKPQWLAFLKDQRTNMHWFEPESAAEVKLEKWFDKQTWRYSRDKGGMNALILRDSGQFIGHAGLLVQTVDDKTELEVAYSLLPEFWGQGYASEAAKFCRVYVFANNLAPLLISIIAQSNNPSKAVARRIGMKKDYATIYHNNAVDIFRIGRSTWERHHQSNSKDSLSKDK